MTTYGPEDFFDIEEYAEEMDAEEPENFEDAMLMLTRGLKQLNTRGDDSANYYGSQDIAGVLLFLKNEAGIETAKIVEKGDKLILKT